LPTKARQPIGETCPVTSGTGTLSQNLRDATDVVASYIATVTAKKDILETVRGCDKRFRDFTQE